MFRVQDNKQNYLFHFMLCVWVVCSFVFVQDKLMLRKGAQVQGRGEGTFK